MTSQTQSAPDILTAAGKLYDYLMAGTLSLETLQDSHIVEEIAQQLVQEKDVMRDKRTAKLWLLYLEMVEILSLCTTGWREGTGRDGMEWKTTAQHIFKKEDQVCSLTNSNTINLIAEIIHIDPQLLLQRLVTAGQCKYSLTEVFKYELFSYPPALFENKFIPREASKSTLADAL